jgi:lipopolysaccharide biosynthesis glycosyltransferase
VLVTDLAAWRAADASERMIRFATSRPLPWFDQDALNVVFAGQWKALDARWNAMNSLWTWPSFADDTYGGPEADAARQRPAILHFEGPLVVKPWHFLSPHPWRAAYRETLGQTAWADVPLAERTLATRAIARLPEQRWLAAYHRWHVARRRLASARRRMAHIFSRAA